MAVKVKDKFATLVCEEREGYKQDRAELDQTSQVVAEYTIPRKATFYQKDNRGLDRERRILDSTAARALEMFAAFMWSHLNNPTHQWAQFFPEGAHQDNDKALRDMPASHRKWLETASEITVRRLTTGKSDLYALLHENYLDLGWHGTGCMFIEEDTEIKWGFKSRGFHMKDIYPDESECGRIDKVIRDFRLTTRQAMQRWPNAGDDLRAVTQGNRGPREKNDFMHIVFPRTDSNLLSALSGSGFRVPSRFRWISAWVSEADNRTLQVGGFNEFPYVVNRWMKMTDDVYGRAPAHTVLGDILMVNQVSDSFLRGAEKLVDPPLIVPDGGLVSPIRMFPGGVTTTDGEQDIRPLLPPGASRIEMGDHVIKSRQEAIREGFFVPLFISPDNPVKTATQVLQEADERNQATSPMVMRQQNELFEPILRRAFHSLYRRRAFPTPPEGLDVKNLTIRYLSPIVTSVKQMEALSMMRMFETIAPFAGVPGGEELFDNFDLDEVARVAHNASGSPARILVGIAQRDKERAARREAEVAQAQADQLPELLKAGAAVQKARQG